MTKTNRITAIAAAAIFGLSAGAALSRADSQGSPKFKKIKMSDKFYSEGATAGDFNKDGTLDYAAGPFWYEGPDFQKRHEIYPPAEIDPKGYSANFLAYSDDFNKDGWADVLVLGFPGQESAWFENPQGKDGHWKRYVVTKVTDNESPTYGDLDGDGKNELIFSAHGHLGWASPNWDKPTEEWTFHKASPHDGRFHKFTHGLGYGDVNGDGKNDLLEAKGWWEQPASLEGDPMWKYHAFDFADGGAQMYAYDVDGDKDSDVITSHQGHGYGLWWWENTGAESNGEIKFQRHVILSNNPAEKVKDTQFSQLHAIDLHDMNNDGLMDIVTGKRRWAHGPTGDAEPNAAPVLYWFELTRADGKADYTPHLIDDDSGVGTQVDALDLNGDKLGDVIVGNKHGQFVFIQEPKQ